MHGLVWRGPACRSLRVRQLPNRELQVLRPRPEVMVCEPVTLFENWVLGTQVCSRCRERSQLFRLRSWWIHQLSTQKWNIGDRHFQSRLCPLDMPSLWHVQGARPSIMLTLSFSVLMGSSACSYRRVLASKPLLCTGATSRALGLLLDTCFVQNCSISKCWELRVAFPDREGQQVRHKSLTATRLQKNVTLPEGDAGEIWAQCL